MKTGEEMGTGSEPIARWRRNCAAHEVPVPISSASRRAYVGPFLTVLVLAVALASAGCNETHAPAATGPSSLAGDAAAPDVNRVDTPAVGKDPAPAVSTKQSDPSATKAAVPATSSTATSSTAKSSSGATTLPRKHAAAAPSPRLETAPRAQRRFHSSVRPERTLPHPGFLCEARHTARAA